MNGGEHPGRTVAITGAARGIGLAIARAFHADGASVAIGDLDTDLAERVAAELGARAYGARLDVTDRECFARFLSTTRQRFGGLHVVVNNAGIMPTGYFLDERDAMTDRMLEVNLRAVLTGTRLAARQFRADGVAGTVVNIASLAGVLYAPGLATYCATKHAVVAVSHSLAREWERDGVRVVAVLPGVVRTELSAGGNYPPWMRPLLEVEPVDVADALLRALRRDRLRVVVPPRLGLLLRTMELVPYRLQRRLERRFHLDDVYTKPDPEARVAYHERISRDLA